MHRDCSVCNCEVIDIINAEFLKPRYERKMGLRELQSLSGCSRSALSRHSINCIPRIRFARNKNRNVAATPMQHRRIVVQWPHNPPIPPNELDKNTVLLVVEYEKGFIGNPGALKLDGSWTLEGQLCFISDVTANVKRGYIESEWEDAMLENTERNATKTETVSDLKASTNGNVTPG